ncbi:MAG: type II toxin-antitoxin system YafQ family toxin [Gemmatimonadetes bacterium]|nr:type II toxin-antitoxin system YafQ family toxin [Gemmatimonadota bacterium]
MRFKRDVKKARKRGKDLGKLRILLASLIEQEPLSARHRDHPLRGIWKGYREAHCTWSAPAATPTSSRSRVDGSR